MKFLLPGKSPKIWLFVIFFATGTVSLFSQTFPLKQDISGKYFITRTKSPFLINAYPAGELSNTEEVVRNITRMSYQGINTIYIRISANQVRFDEKGHPGKEEKKRNAFLKRLIREAALKNMLVLIHPETNNPDKEENRDLYLRYTAAKLKNFKHVGWILSKADLQDEKLISGFSSKQLKGLLITGFTNFDSLNFDFAVCSDTCKNSDLPKPAFQLVKTYGTPETTAESIRNQVYTAIMEGACGTIVNAPLGPSFSVLNPITGNLRQMKTVFDTVGWHQWQPYPSVFYSENKKEMNSRSVINNHLNQVVIYHPSGAPLHLSFGHFKTKMKITWINPVSGKKLEGYANHLPSDQIFLPPYQEGNNSDWLLLIEPEKPPKPDKPAKRSSNPEEK